MPPQGSRMAVPPPPLPPPPPPPRAPPPCPPPPPYTPPPCPPPWFSSAASSSVSVPLPVQTPQDEQTRKQNRVVICFRCNLPGHFARKCPLYYDLRLIGITVPHKQCAKYKRFGH
jgi:hypothetical protein